MSLESALLYLVAILVFAVTPGPGVFALLARGMASGARACAPLATEQRRVVARSSAE